MGGGGMGGLGGGWRWDGGRGSGGVLQAEEHSDRQYLILNSEGLLRRAGIGRWGGGGELQSLCFRTATQQGRNQHGWN